jgi:hypothetical protein
LSAGSILYSDGVNIQELSLGSEGEGLYVESGAPIWRTPVFQWDQTTGGAGKTMRYTQDEVVQEFQTGFEIIGFKITKVEWSARRNSGTGANLEMRCEVVNSSCVVQDTLGVDIDASTVGASFEYISFTGSTTNYAITNTDLLRLRIVSASGTGTDTTEMEGERASSGTVANTRGGYVNDACVQTFYTSSSTIKVTYTAV